MFFKNSLYYKFGQTSSKKYRFFKLLIPLELPYIFLSLTYILFRFYMLERINLIFLFVLLFASSWFIIGPHLVYNFISLFLSFQENIVICKELRQYFKENEQIHFKIYRLCLIVEGTIISLFGLVPIVLSPDILTNNITFGITDIFFWLIIIYLIWFLFYCANATSFISLIAFKIIRDISHDKVFVYNPMNAEQHQSIEEIRGLCNKAVAYTCSGLVFIPLAIYFFLQQPQLKINCQTHTWIITLFPFQHPIYLIWVISLMLIYCGFLFLFITYPNYKLKKYIQQKNKHYLLQEEMKYMNSFVERPTILSIQQKNILSEQLYQYNVYLRLQEIKSLCKASFSFDPNTIVTYVAIVVTIVSAVPGFIQLFRTLG